MSVTRLVRRTASTAESAVLLLLPHGGQRLARGNAWEAMALDADRARSRSEAMAALAAVTDQRRVAASG
jgi:hypothetical protein